MTNILGLIHIFLLLHQVCWLYGSRPRNPIPKETFKMKANWRQLQQIHATVLADVVRTRQILCEIPKLKHKFPVGLTFIALSITFNMRKQESPQQSVNHEGQDKAGMRKGGPKHLGASPFLVLGRRWFWWHCLKMFYPQRLVLFQEQSEQFKP